MGCLPNPGFLYVHRTSSCAAKSLDDRFSTAAWLRSAATTAWRKCSVRIVLTWGQTSPSAALPAIPFAAPFTNGNMTARAFVGRPASAIQPPKNALLFKFPSVEKFGLIWAFNGLEPWWQIPEFPLPESELAIDVRYDVPVIPVDPWVVCANTPDWQHIKIVHNVDFDASDMLKRVKFTDHSMQYRFSGRMTQENNEEVDYNVGIYGTSMFVLHGTRNGQWFCAMNAFGLLRPGVTQDYFVIGLKKGDGSPQSDATIKFLHNAMFQMGRRMVAEDRPILHTLKYAPGAMTRSDEALARFLDYVRAFPRSHHSADFIN